MKLSDITKEVNMVKEEEVKATKKEVKVDFELAEVVTGTAIGIKNVSTGEAMTTEQAIVQLLNDVASIKRSLI